jgi:tetratricopeptide (TPR) repeat protein
MHDTHLWITGADRAARAAAAAAYAPDAVADCDRRLRGPYTGTGSLLRALVPETHALDPGLVARHAIEILAVAPELDPLIGPAPGTLTSLAPPQERTRWYSRYRTRRLAHGVIDFLRQAARHPLTLALDAADDADPTDLEFISIALRRLDPGRVRLIVGTRASMQALSEPLAAYSKHQIAADVTDEATADQAPDDLAAAFVASDGTSDRPRQRDAYLAADPRLRERLHDQRAAELEARNEWSLKLGAIPYHKDRGSGPAAQVKEAYAAAIDYCGGMAFYDAALELTGRMAKLIDPDNEPKEFYLVQTQMCQWLAMLERPAETEPVHYDLLARGEEPTRHMNICYSQAMLYTRLYQADHKDHRKALAYVNTAIALASQLPDPEDRAFHTVFMKNGKALVEMHLGNLHESLRLVAEGIDRLDRELPPGKHELHRSVLHHNRANVYAALGRMEQALADFDHVIEVDPNYPEYHFDRGSLLHKLGRHAEAMADYETAMRLDGPFPELYYNRGDLRSAMGDVAGAIADFRYVLDLEPGYVDATVSLASLLLDEGRPAEAAEQARAGLELGPDEARLHCTLGLTLLELTDYPAASAAFDRALELDPDLSEALVNRAVAAYERGSFDNAVTDLTVALESKPGDPDLLYNRGRVHEAAGRPYSAAADYTCALGHPDADRPELLDRRVRCHLALGRLAEAQADIDSYLALGESPHADELHDLLRAAAGPGRIAADRDGRHDNWTASG